MGELKSEFSLILSWSFCLLACPHQADWGRQPWPVAKHLRTEVPSLGSFGNAHRIYSNHQELRPYISYSIHISTLYRKHVIDTLVQRRGDTVPGLCFFLACPTASGSDTVEPSISLDCHSLWEEYLL